MKAITYLIINLYLKSRTSDHRPYVTLACEHGGALRKYTKPRVEDEEEEVAIKEWGPYGIKKNRKSHVPPCNILRFFSKNKMLIVHAQKIYNVVAKIKKNKMQGQNTVDEVLCLSAQRGYTVLYRNAEDSNVLSDIVVAHPTSIAMIKTWPYILIIDTTYNTNKYNMPLLEAVGMTSTGKNFTVATAFMRNEQATTFKWWQRRPNFLHYLFNAWLNPLAHKFCRVWTSEVLHFGVETMNRAESEHLVLKLWLSTFHGDLDTVLLNIDSLIECQIVEIKSLLKISKLKEKYGMKSNPILKNIKIGVDIPTVHERDMDCECYKSSVPDDPCAPLTIPLPKRQSQKDDRRRIHPKRISLTRNSGSGSGLGSGSGSRFGSSARGRGRPPHASRGRERRRSSRRSSLSFVVNPDTPSTPFPYIDAFPSFVYEFIQNWKNVVGGDARWMSAVSIAGPMAISSRYTSQWVGRTLL
ncbi:hypothetical protein M9H77_21773 [Catharanthus roseus]|uniref:Uncharacterized protein n=1 Tax=Catharanthus roseus TaxID=4058 RepID=A0ACC0AQB7_CATRO|nr:hypothetical protein M9H77_21773 [Catharanthus roseus]